MDDCRFDELARAVATPRSRRSILGGVVAGLAALTGRETTAQSRRNKAAGAACARSTECASFRCVDGVCCDSPCTGQCEACNAPGSVGTCVPVSGAPVGRRAACPGSGPCQAVCDGVNRSACAFPGEEVACGASTCEDGWQTTYACAGNGTCAPATVACGPDELCQEGACVACPAGASPCGGGCVACTGGRIPNPTTCACECPAGTEPVSVNDSPPTCLPVCPADTSRCNGDCVPFCELNTPHAGGCAECVCPPGGMTCTLTTNHERDQTCCAADQECCRVGSVDDPSTVAVCCRPGACVPGTGCATAACPGQRDCGGGVCVPTTSCCPGETRACYSGPAGTAGVGVCRAGTQICQGNGAFGPCVGEILPQPETCNGLDDDCDGQADGVDVCGVDCPEGEEFCGGACVDVLSNDQHCGFCGNVCGEDMPCVDGDCSCPNEGQPCDTGALGVCAAGVIQCFGNFSTCVQTTAPSLETCNGLDDDCDGVVDEEVFCPGVESGEFCQPDNFGEVRCCYHDGLPAPLRGLSPDCDRCCSRDCNSLGFCS